MFMRHILLSSCLPRGTIPGAEDTGEDERPKTDLHPCRADLVAKEVFMFLDWPGVANVGRAHVARRQACEWICLHKGRCPAALAKSSCAQPSLPKKGRQLLDASLAPLHEQLGPCIQMLKGHQVHTAQKEETKHVLPITLLLTRSHIYKVCAHGRRKGLVNE